MEDGLNNDMGILSSELARTGQDRRDSDGHLNKGEPKVFMLCPMYLRVRLDPLASFFFGVHAWLVKVLGQFSIIKFRGLGLRIGVWVRVRVSVVLWSG